MVNSAPPCSRLRASMVSDPLGKRKNTGDNTPAIIHTELVAGDHVEVALAAWQEVNGQGPSRVELEIDAPLLLEAERRVREMLPSRLREAPFRIAINRAFVGPGARVAAGDELALLPPMQGG